MAFTKDQQSRIMHFLRYPDWESVAQSIHLGYPAVSQHAFLVESSFDRMSEAAVQTVLKDLAECECIEEQISSARKNLSATKIGNVTMREDQLQALRAELEQWVTTLGNDLGVIANPHAQPSMGGTFNARVLS